MPFLNKIKNVSVISIFIVYFLALFYMSYPAYVNGAEKVPKDKFGDTLGLKEENAPNDQNAEDEKIPYEYTDPDFDQNRVSYPLMVLRTVIVLAVIVIGIYLIFRFLVKNKNKLMADTDIIKVLASYPLTANRMIQVVDIAGKILVLGVTDSSINLITTVEEKEVIDQIKLLNSKEAKIPGSFREQFFKLIGGRVFSKSGQVSYFSNYKKRVDRMRKF